MAGTKRERELARAKFERQQARRAAEAAKRRRRNTVVAAATGVAVVALAVFWFLRPSSDSTPTASSSVTPSPTATGASPSSSSTVKPASCTSPPPVRKDDKSWDTPPEQRIKSGDKGTYTIDFTTNCGPIQITLDAAKAPVTSNSMVFLTNEKFFDDTSCHRLTTQGIFVLQCGDPTATGSGGPGYTIPDENLPKAGADNYPAGTVAMANSGANTNGSQFFIVYDNTTLGPNYTIWGKVTKGLDVVKAVAAQGVVGGGGDGKPQQPISILTGKTSYTTTVE